MDGGVADTATCSYTGRLPERKALSEGRVGASARQHLPHHPSGRKTMLFPFWIPSPHHLILN